MCQFILILTYITNGSVLTTGHLKMEADRGQAHFPRVVAPEDGHRGHLTRAVTVKAWPLVPASSALFQLLGGC